MCLIDLIIASGDGVLHDVDDFALFADRTQTLWA